MGILITILAVIAGLVLLILVLALIAPREYKIYRDVVINKPKAEVFDYIRYLKNQKNYNYWVMIDPAKKEEFRGTDGTVGFVYAWNGNKQAGEGAQEIKNIVEGERVEVEIRFVRPFAGTSQTPFTVEEIAPGQTKVNWEMTSTMSYPMNAMQLFINMDKMLGKELEKSLEKLKSILEKE